MEGIIKQLHEAETILAVHIKLSTPPGPELNQALERVEQILELTTDMCRAVRRRKEWMALSYQSMETD